MGSPNRPGRPITQAEYEALATFRNTLNRFLAFSKAAARAAGLTPRQHQALLAVKGSPGGRPVTMGDLARRLLIRHHSAVGLVDRLASSGLLARQAVAQDRRRVRIVVTQRGGQILERLAAAHREELRQFKLPLQAVLEGSGAAVPARRAGHRKLASRADPPSSARGSQR